MQLKVKSRLIKITQYIYRQQNKYEKTNKEEEKLHKNLD